MPHNSLEISIILASCRLELDNSLDSIFKKNSNNINWEILIQTGYEHGVNSLLCNSLLKVKTEYIPEQIYHASIAHLKQQQETNQQLSDQLVYILNVLKDKNIDTISFKGPTLAISAYKQLKFRSFRDLDFLIHESDIQQCLDTLRELGYVHNWDLTPRQWQEFINYAGEDILFGEGVPIEPHWAFAPSTLALNIDYEGIWKRAIHIEFNGQSLRSLSTEDNLIILCVHGCKEEWTKLKWVVDVSEFIRSHPEMDWELIFRLTTSQGLARIVNIGLALSHKLVQAPIPNIALEWMSKDKFAAKWTEQLADNFFITNNTDLDIWKPGKFHWSMRERLIDRLRYFFQTISQPRVQYFADIKLPDKLFFLYWPYKLLHDFIVLPVWIFIKKFR
ncbi:MAG: nucleotidyltransferase family protein [Gammaproteobacteria bacterium]|nr:nucleotidyltransferase family protein [Gammaproteobacteria bacterium]